MYRTVRSNWRLYKTIARDNPPTKDETNIANSIIFVQFGAYDDSSSSQSSICQVNHPNGKLAAKGNRMKVRPTNVSVIDAVTFGGAYGVEPGNSYGWMVFEIYVPK